MMSDLSNLTVSSLSLPKILPLLVTDILLSMDVIAADGAPESKMLTTEKAGHTDL